MNKYTLFDLLWKQFSIERNYNCEHFDAEATKNYSIESREK